MGSTRLFFNSIFSFNIFFALERLDFDVPSDIPNISEISLCDLLSAFALLDTYLLEVEFMICN